MRNTLQFYTVHLTPRRTGAGPVFVREGFSFWAFLFSGFWTLYHRLWLATACVVAVNVLIAFLEKKQLLASPVAGALVLGVHLLCGLCGNDWRRAKLKRSGFVTASIVAAPNLSGAQLRFFDQREKPGIA